MATIVKKIGFTYFASENYFIDNKAKVWLPTLRELGATFVVFQTGFDRAIPEDIFLTAKASSLEPIVHFSSELPLPRKFNDAAVLLDVYSKWGVKQVIFGDKPNLKTSWMTAGWHEENLIDHFLDRFIPLANHAIRIGIKPILGPMKPGGDYWDLVFVELILKGLKRRRLDEILENLFLSSYGFTFDKSLSWGKGGPEQWSGSKPYMTLEGQEDQLGFHNFEWVQAVSQQVVGVKLPVLILDSGNTGADQSLPDWDGTKKAIRNLFCSASEEKSNTSDRNPDNVEFDDSVQGLIFSLDTLDQVFGEELTYDDLVTFFEGPIKIPKMQSSKQINEKLISHYLLLPFHDSGVSDVILNKVRPLIKKFHPTVGFSLKEAGLAKKVSVFPDAKLFTEKEINALRSAGCSVELLPDSGIEIATMLHSS